MDIKRRLTKEEKEFIFKNYEEMSAKQLSEVLCCNINTIYYQLNKNKLSKDKKEYFLNKMREVLFSLDYTLISNEFIGSKEKYKILCNKHKIIKKNSYDSIVQGKFRCKHCEHEILINKLNKNTTEVKNEFYKRNLKPIFNDEDYINEKIKLPFICNIHNDEIQEITYDSLKRTIYGCIFCSIESRANKCKGELSHLWKGGIRSEEKTIRDSIEYKKWRENVFEKDNYLCQCCGSNRNLNAHHIECFSDCVDLRYEVSNGITLCEKCHMPNFENSFHNLYGTHHNSRNQLEEYLENFK